jgi:hypothetical protein
MALSSVQCHTLDNEAHIFHMERILVVYISEDALRKSWPPTSPGKHEACFVRVITTQQLNSKVAIWWIVAHRKIEIPSFPSRKIENVSWHMKRGIETLNIGVLTGQRKDPKP